MWYPMFTFISPYTTTTRHAVRVCYVAITLTISFLLPWCVHLLTFCGVSILFDQFLFSVKTEDRELWLAADNQQQKKAWLDAISKAIRLARQAHGRERRKERKKGLRKRDIAGI